MSVVLSAHILKKKKKLFKILLEKVQDRGPTNYLLSTVAKCTETNLHKMQSKLFHKSNKKRAIRN